MLIFLSYSKLTEKEKNETNLWTNSFCQLTQVERGQLLSQNYLQYPSLKKFTI